MNIGDLLTITNFLKFAVASLTIIAVIILLSTNNWNIKKTILSILNTQKEDKTLDK